MTSLAYRHRHTVSRGPRGDSNPRHLPRIGVSIAQALLDTRYPIETWAKMIGGYFFGRGITRINFMSAAWPDTSPWFIWPFKQRSDGKFDLYDWDPRFWEDRLPRFVENHNHYGTVVQGDILDLYSMSYRKEVAFDKTLGPYVNNVNGIRFLSTNREEDDILLTKTLPQSDWLKTFTQKLATTLRGAGVIFEPGNEFPEKPLHELMAKWWKEKDPDGVVSTNRQDDTPGQYQNMLKRDSPIDLISFHGWKNLDFLTRSFKPSKDELERNPTRAAQRPWNFDEFFKNRWHDGTHAGFDFNRIICSSDGARNTRSSDPDTAYIWDPLFEVHKFVWQKGGSVEHQSAQKLRPGNLSFVEHGYLRRLQSLKER